MTAAPALPWPSSRTLLGWWRELAVLQPHRFGFSHLPLHRVEALVRLGTSRRLEPLLAALLRWLHVSPRSDCSFDLSVLEACIRQGPEWKARYHFPADVEAVEQLDPHDPSAWRSVILDRTELLSVAWIEKPEAETSSLVGFLVRTEGWNLECKTP